MGPRPEAGRAAKPEVFPRTHQNKMMVAVVVAMVPCGAMPLTDPPAMCCGGWTGGLPPRLETLELRDGGAG
eukprot:1428368-Amphidinium_carterae.2